MYLHLNWWASQTILPYIYSVISHTFLLQIRLQNRNASYARVMQKSIHFHSEKSLFTLIYKLTCLWICYAIRRVNCLYYYTLDVDVSSRTHVLSNQEISIELSYIIVSMQTYSTIIAFNIFIWVFSFLFPLNSFQIVLASCSFMASLFCSMLLRPDTGLKIFFFKNVLFIDIITSKDWLLLL